MKKYADFSRIEDHQLGIHERLMNWRRWCVVRPQQMVQPMFKMYRPAQHWHEKEFRPTCDLIDAQRIEGVVRHLPPRHAFAIRWWYAWCFPVGIAQRHLATNAAGLEKLIRDGRQMVSNLVD